MINKVKETILVKPILLTRGLIVFPETTVNIEVGRVKSVTAVEEAYKSDKKIIVVSQKDSQIEEPKLIDIFSMGTICTIIKLQKNDDASLTITVKGNKRVKIIDLLTTETSLSCKYEPTKEIGLNDKDNSEKLRLMLSMFEKNMRNLSSKEATDLKKLLLTTPAINKVIDQIASVLPINLIEKQRILDELNIPTRLDIIITHVSSNEDKKSLDNEINRKINETLAKQQREFYLREKMRIVKEQLGEISSREEEQTNLRKRLESNPYPEHIKKRALQEINRMEASANPQEAAINRQYVEWLLDLP
jgi:ATP-dependent Lon protease